MYESQLSAVHIRNALANTLFHFSNCCASHIFYIFWANKRCWSNMNLVLELKYKYSDPILFQVKSTFVDGG